VVKRKKFYLLVRNGFTVIVAYRGDCAHPPDRIPNGTSACKGRLVVLPIGGDAFREMALAGDQRVVHFVQKERLLQVIRSELLETVDSVHGASGAPNTRVAAGTTFANG